MGKKYLLGLDIGTNSVGWCLTDENYNVVKKNGKSLWGVRLFDEAKTAAERRGHRSSRRRLARRKQRIKWLSDLFCEEINKIDKTFFTRLNESRLVREDKKETKNYPYLLFNDINYSDKDFFKDYPTMYHLINEMADNFEKKYDIRMVYLACAYLIKYRGNFLYPGEFKINDYSSILDNFNNIKETLAKIDIELEANEELISNVITECGKRKNISSKKEELKKMNPHNNKILEQYLNLIAGAKVSLVKSILAKIDDIETDKEDSIDCSSEKFDDTISELLTKYPQYEDYINAMADSKKIHDFIILKRLLLNHRNLAELMVDRYERHKENLGLLKQYVKRSLPQETKIEIFRTHKDKLCNYSSYIGSSKDKDDERGAYRCSQEDFEKYLKKVLKIDSIKNADEIKDEDLRKIYEKLNEGDFLPRQNSKTNSLFPKQLNEELLKTILENQSKFYPFLESRDEYGSVKEKILSIFNYRVPYYVGPLYFGEDKNKGKYSWAIRRSQGDIYPWTFDKVIDKEASNKEFIRRMQNDCTYLKGEKCLPKDSLTYSKYMVFSELNKLKIKGQDTLLSQEDKEYLLDNLYYKKKSVSKKNIEDTLRIKYNDKSLELDQEGKKEQIEIQGNLKSYIDMIEIFDKDFVDSNYVFVEELIKDIALCEDKDILEKTLISTFKEFKIDYNRDLIKKLKKLNYSKWGRFSKKLLDEMPGFDDEGVIIDEGITILKRMETTNENLMEILENVDDKYGYRRAIYSFNNVNVIDNEYNIDSVKRSVDEMYASPMMKRALIQTFKIIFELEHIIHQPIEEIYVETTRKHETDKNKKKTPDSRYNAVKKLYDEMPKEERKLYQTTFEHVKQKLKSLESDESSENNDLSDRKHKQKSSLKSDYIYLYFMQLGIDLYTGKPIDFDELFKANSSYDIDHIYPQSKMKDDSIDNRVLVSKDENNNKSDKFPYDCPNWKAGFNRIQFYEFLNKNKLMSAEKLKRLTRKTPLTDDELAEFVNRQIVSTSQSVKAVTDLLKIYKPNAKIVYSKGNWVSEFRHRFDLVKSRDANNYHHAHDAYLNIIVGRVYNYYYTEHGLRYSKWREQHPEWTFNPMKVFDDNKEHNRKNIVDDTTNIVLWNYRNSIDNIKKQLYERFDVLVTTRTYINTDLLSKDSITPSKDVKKAFPLKKGLDSTKYGGYSSLSYSFFLLVESYDKKKNKQYTIEAIPGFLSPKTLDLEQVKTNEAILNYLSTELKLIDPKIILIVKINSIFSIGKSRLAITGKTNDNYLMKNVREANFSKDEMLYIRKLSKAYDVFTQKGLYSKNSDEIAEKMNIGDNYLLVPARTEKNEEIWITKDEEINLYTVLKDKFDNEIYKNISGIQNVKKVVDSYENIEDLTLYDLVYVNYQILNALKCDRTYSDLIKIGGKESTGQIKISKNLKPGISIIYESTTGFYSKVVWEYKE